jgi:hypothetical protein
LPLLDLNITLPSMPPKLSKRSLSFRFLHQNYAWVSLVSDDSSIRSTCKQHMKLCVVNFRILLDP